jgi:cytochrome c peroxidase
MHILPVVSCLLLACLVPLTAVADEPAAEGAVLAVLPTEVPFPEGNPPSPEKIELGKLLFFDPRLSGDGTMSCATCHVPDKGWGDGLPRAQGHEGKILARNTPTLLNVAFHSSLFWDGRAATLEEQALGPIESPEEMNQDLDELERKLNAIPGYVEQFQKVFGTEVTRNGIAKALAAFQRTLITGPAPLDRYLSGDKEALSPLARRGLELFTGTAGCVRCHHGPLLNDGKFYRLGVSFADEGRMAVTQDPADRARFRTPSLRNIAETGPFMHNGSRRTLEETVEFYLRDVPTTAPGGMKMDIEPILELSYSDIAALVAFLKALSGETPQVEAPELP